MAALQSWVVAWLAVQVVGSSLGPPGELGG
jgi:hypothetical protein